MIFGYLSGVLGGTIFLASHPADDRSPLEGHVWTYGFAIIIGIYLGLLVLSLTVYYFVNRWKTSQRDLSNAIRAHVLNPAQTDTTDSTTAVNESAEAALV